MPERSNVPAQSQSVVFSGGIRRDSRSVTLADKTDCFGSIVRTGPDSNFRSFS